MPGWMQPNTTKANKNRVFLANNNNNNNNVLKTKQVILHRLLAEDKCMRLCSLVAKLN
jgi:hypothetical protein